MNNWERLARALLPGATKHIDHWNQRTLTEMNTNTEIRVRAELRRLSGASAGDFLLWSLEMEDEDA